MLLLLTVSCASAATSFEINKLNEPIGLDVKAQVTYDADNNCIIFEDTSTGLTTPRIILFAYNLDVAPDRVVSYNEAGLISGPWTDYWEPAKNNQVDGFGDFAQAYDLKQSSFTNNADMPTTVIVYFPASYSFDGTVPGNGYDYKTDKDNSPEGNEVALHIAWDSPTDPVTSIKITGETPSDPEIPEFPTIAMPVAAILGILFFMGRRRTE